MRIARYEVAAVQIAHGRKLLLYNLHDSKLLSCKLHYSKRLPLQIVALLEGAPWEIAILQIAP